ncbi:MAG: S8 family serine peptidase, partial [Anaerolineales bacterium]
VPGEVIVGFAEGMSAKQSAAQAAALAGEVGAQVAEVSANTALLRFAPDADVPALAEQLGGMADVAFAEPNYINWIPEENALGEAYPVDEVRINLQMTSGSGKREKTLSEIPDVDDVRQLTLSINELWTARRMSGKQSIPAFPTDPFLWNNWGWDYVQADIIWPDKAANPMVCVIDTGVDINHPDLKGRALNGRDFVNDNESPNIANDDNGHGTHVAGTIAAVMNNKKGIAGISTGKVLAVKVLSAQGWGTTYDIVQGIRYCADNPYVKVINMSLGGPSSDAEYNALYYAIVTKGKLVVAAAGNSSTSNRSYPAGWADHGVIGGGLVSVAAARPRYSMRNDDDGDGLLWVDTNGNDVQDSGELFYPDQCAAFFSNYGSWVEMIAPGESILSTVPLSYNYYDNYFGGVDADGDGYEWFDGTSMAAPHVAGAAARVWSVFPTYTNSQIASRLWEEGDEADSWWTTAMDPDMSDPASGYSASWGGGEAPYCWPDGTKGAEYSMDNARYLNVAAAMGRGAIVAAVTDALTGLPLENAYVYARDYYTGALKDTAVVSRGNRIVYLLNLPEGWYSIYVNKSGYTSGAAWVAYQSTAAGDTYTGPWLWLGVPPRGNITAVANWYDESDLDLFTWLPNVSSPGGVVGSSYSGHPQYQGMGDLSDFPRARWNRDGGWMDWMGMESISIAPRPGYPTIPYYNQTSSDYYDFLMRDFGALSGYVILRIWTGGKVIGATEANPACSGGDLWYWAGYLWFDKYEPVDWCGDSGVWPYANSYSPSGVLEKPTTSK